MEIVANPELPVEAAPSLPAYLTRDWVIGDAINEGVDVDNNHNFITVARLSTFGYGPKLGTLCLGDCFIQFSSGSRNVNIHNGVPYKDYMKKLEYVLTAFTFARTALQEFTALPEEPTGKKVIVKTYQKFLNPANAESSGTIKTFCQISYFKMSNGKWRSNITAHVDVADCTNKLRIYYPWYSKQAKDCTFYDVYIDNIKYHMKKMELIHQYVGKKAADVTFPEY